MAIVHPTAENFDALIRDNKLVLVDFFAIEEVAEEYEGKAVVAKIDVDEAQEIAAEYGISSIPTVILFKDGAPIHTEVGAHDKAFYANLIEMHL